MPKMLRFEDLGLIDYAAAVAVQKQRLEAVRQGADETVFLLEHPPTVTFGRNGGSENLPFNPDFFTGMDVSVVFSSRGGNITCHFPGQLVVYPILRMDKKKGGIRRVVHDLEQAVIAMLAEYGIAADHREGFPGVWIGHKKIASVGMAMKHWVSWHGIAVNIAAGLSLFDVITPCGLPGVTATSLSRELGAPAPFHAGADANGLAKSISAPPAYAPGVSMERAKASIRSYLEAAWANR